MRQVIVGGRWAPLAASSCRRPYRAACVAIRLSWAAVQAGAGRGGRCHGRRSSGARRVPPGTPRQLSFAVRIVMVGNGTLETKHVTISKTFPGPCGPLFLLPPYAVNRAGIGPPTPKTPFKWKKLRLKYANNRCSGHGQWHTGRTLCFCVCLWAG